MSDNPYRDLPAVDVLVDELDLPLPRAVITDVARLGLDQARDELADGGKPDPVELASSLGRAVVRSSGIPVINATGVLLHTNLGRARWSRAAIQRATVVAEHPTNVEIDLESGQRGRRGSYASRLLCLLTGADDALVVNNNASALVLALAALAGGRSTVVARGELIEIGGSYRLPEVMEASGTSMVEVGTTNRNRLSDYQTALQLYDVAALLKVHPSNYRIEGFTAETSVDDLRSLDPEVSVIHDIGSGLLDSSAAWIPEWLRDEPAARQSLEAGANLVMFSGDKLLGGPQAGILVGDADSISKVRGHPLARALRVDGVTYAALEATLETYLEPLPTAIPFWRQALMPAETIRNRSEVVAEATGAEVREGNSKVGGGSAPGAPIPGYVIRFGNRDDLFEDLLQLDRPVLTRRLDGDLILDLRTVDEDQDELIVEAIRKCL